MAKDNKRESRSQRAKYKQHTAKINALAKFLNSNGDGIKRTVTYTDPKDDRDYERVTSGMEDTLDRLLDGINTDGSSNAGGMGSSSLTHRFADNGTSEEDIIKMQKDFNNLLALSANDSSFLSGMANDDLVEHDLRIDTVLHYCPKLDEALNAKADCILSADHFDRTFINVTSESSAEQEESVFNQRVSELMEMHEFEDKADEWYREAAKYGEVYVYRVPFDKATSRLLRAKDASNMALQKASINACGIVGEGVSCNWSKDESEMITENFGEDFSIEVEINKSGLITDVVNEAYSIHEAMSFNESMCLSSFNEVADDCDGEAISAMGRAPKRKYDVLIPSDSLDYKSFNKVTRHKGDKVTITGAEDGLVDPSKTSISNYEINIPGTIIKKLPRKNVIPRYIGDTCLGYTYIELLDTARSENQRIRNFRSTINPINTMTGYTQNHPDAKKESPDEEAVKFMAKRIASFIDTNFVNNNQDIAQDIYTILKYNDDLCSNKKVRITFIPPQDMCHIFFKQDPITHRGISDIEDSIVPATLYSAMFITNAIWNLTRGQDKRVYYVKQNVDTNTSQVLLNTIDQIKKGNMGIRQIENISHILNVTGRFNDYLIPTSASGEEPMRMEILQGQTVELQSELMQVLLEAAIIPTGIPMEYIEQRRSVEFATQLTMSNNKFLMIVYKRQNKVQKILTKELKVMYFNQYGETCALKVKLPPPMFLNITNINQIMMNVADMAQKLVEIMGVGYNEEILPYVQKAITVKYLGTYIDLDDIEDIMKNAEHEYMIEHKSENGEEM